MRIMISKINYMQNLSIDVVSINPIYASPNDDKGYDISDYQDIMKEFGTMEDFDELLGGLHKRNIRLVMDLVVNHTSDEHEWFRQSKSSRKNPYRNYYHWWPAEKARPPHRPSFFDEEGHKIVDPSRHELNMLYHFEGMGIGYVWGEFKRVDPDGYDLVKFKEVYTKWNDVFARKGWGTIYLGNHDQPRMVSRWGNDGAEFKTPSAKMLITFLFTMHATPFFYFGDEIGMSNIRFDKISDYRDIETINMYKQIKRKKGDVKRFLENQKESARDNSRTPFQWDGSPNAGFTKGVPWLKVNPNHTEYNVELQDEDPDSILNYFRKMIRVRKAHPVLLYGFYHLLDKEHKQVYAYTRTLGDEKFLILLNFSKESLDYKIPGTFRHDEEILINNYKTCEQHKDKIHLQPYQAIVMQAKQ